MNQENDDVKGCIGAVSRVVLSLLPYGGSIATLLSELEQAEFKKKIDMFINKTKALLQCHSNEIDNLKDNQEKLKEILNLTSATVQKLRLEWDESKIPGYAKLLKNCFLSPEPLDKKMQLIEQFSRLSQKDINVLKDFESEEAKAIQELVYGHYPKNYLESLIPSIVKLESYWLIEESFETKWSAISISTDSETQKKWRNKRYKLTSYGLALLQLIR